MAAIPPFILKKLYVNGSLQSSDEGVSFALRNTLAPGTIMGLQVAVDGKTYPPEETILRVGEEERSADTLSPDQPQKFGLGETVTVVLKGLSLDPGEHKVQLQVKTREAGTFAFDITDKV